MRWISAVLACWLSWQAQAYTLFVHDRDLLSVEIARHFAEDIARLAGLPVSVRLLSSAEQLRQASAAIPDSWTIGPATLSAQHTGALTQRTLGLLYRVDMPLQSPSGHRIGAIEDDAGYAPLKAANPDSVFVPYASSQTAIKELAAGIVDGVIAPMADLTMEVTRWQINGLRFANWVAQDPIVIHHDMNPALSARLDEAVARLAPQIHDFEARYLLGQTHPAPTASTLPWVYLIAMGACALASLAVLWAARRARRQARAASAAMPHRAPEPARAVDAPRSDRGQAYLNEVNQQLQQEVMARQAKEAELLAVQRELNDAHERLAEQVRTDPLTQLANRRHFDEVLAREWRRHAREQLPLTIVLADIDHFKGYNDALGHPAGDECLRQVAAALGQAFNRSGDLVARYGGEEFVMLLPSSDARDAEHQVSRLQDTMAALNIPHPNSSTAAHVTLSMGIAACIPMGEDDAWGLVEEADQALYEAKNQGRNRYRVVAA